MNSKERIKCALSHKVPDKLPVDFGSSSVTGMHVINVYRLRQYFGLDKPGTPVKIIHPLMMIGEIKNDLKDIIGSDVTGLKGKGTIFGFDNDNWKEWKLTDGTPVLVPGLFNTTRSEDGCIYQYPEGDKLFSRSAKMPNNGMFFNPIIRQKEFNEEDLKPENNLEEYKLFSNSDLSYLGKQFEKISKNKYAVLTTAVDSSFGDIAIILGMGLKELKGIRNMEEWYISLYKRKDYIKKVFEGLCAIAIENYKRLFNIVGNDIEVADISETDFGSQNGLFISKETYRELFKPYHKEINNWIHNNTEWKCFIHSCGSIYELIPDFIEAGFDILNPIQISAERMDPLKIKKEFGKNIIFWGGGINTQKTLPFGNPKEVKEEVRRLIDVFSAGGGFVFNAVHNITGDVPLENIIAMIEVIQEYRK